MNFFSEDYKENAFWVWYNGGELTYTRLINTLDPTEDGNKPGIGTINNWREKYKWVARAAEMNNEARAALRADAVKTKAEMFGRHADQAKKMSDAAYKWFEDNDWEFKTPRDALKAISIATAIERDSRGIPDAILKAAASSNDSIENRIMNMLSEANSEDMSMITEIIASETTEDSTVIDAEVVDNVEADS